MSDRMRKLIQEKFGYTKNLPTVNQMHDDVTAGKEPQPSAHPLEKYRSVIKAIMGATSTEEDGILENVIDFAALHRLANKYAFAPAVINNFSVIETEIQKPKTKRDRETINTAWESVKKDIPHWFVGMLQPKKDEVLPDLDKKNITNLLTLMDRFNKESEKAGKEAAKETETADRSTQAKKNLDKARKAADVEVAAGSEKKLKETPEEVEGVETKAKEPELPEDDSKKETPKENKKDK